jgi:hypothetical protein
MASTAAVTSAALTDRRRLPGRGQRIRGIDAATCPGSAFDESGFRPAFRGTGNCCSIGPEILDSITATRQDRAVFDRTASSLCRHVSIDIGI